MRTSLALISMLFSADVLSFHCVSASEGAHHVGPNFSRHRRRYSSRTPARSTTSVEDDRPQSAVIAAPANGVVRKSVETTSTSRTSSTLPSSSPSATPNIDPILLQDMKTILERRLKSIVRKLERGALISTWLSTIGPDGKWPDSEVNYAAGCSARRANWPAQEHWKRIVSMAGAWAGGLVDAEHFAKNVILRDAISRAMDYWFQNDFSDPSCVHSGGQGACPCGTPGLWNTNWYSNTILIPRLCGSTCLLLKDTLTDVQLAHCTRITSRAYSTFDHRAGYLTGANTLDVAKIGIDQALLTTKVSLMSDAFRRVHGESVIKNSVKADGIRADGSFGQHGGIPYNGNYGKDFTNVFLDLEMQAAGTQFAASNASKNAFETLLQGDSWMIYRNALTGVNHWDFSTLGRFISFPVIDKQATSRIKIDLTEIKSLGQQWNSDVLVNFADSLSGDSKTANAAGLIGNRMFYTNDYMVHRGSSYITTLKMYSRRTLSTECFNSQNPFGFHLSDGTVYTYVQGDEYEDIAAAWDWNLIPGTTVDYGATDLTCDRASVAGSEVFVEGASTGSTGVGVMRYTNPLTGSLKWQKAWFFLEDDVQHVMIAGVASSTAAPVFSVLDQRRHAGDVQIDGSVIHERGNISRSGARSLWHGGVGYIFPDTPDDSAIQRRLQVGEKIGNWTKIGISTQPPAPVDVFAAWLEHRNTSVPIAYTAMSGVDASVFNSKRDRLQLKNIQNDAHVSAVYNPAHGTVMAVFWDAKGGVVDFGSGNIAADGNLALIYNVQSGELTVSDPSQSLKTVRVTINSTEIQFDLPSDGLAGSSVTRNVKSDKS